MRFSRTSYFAALAAIPMFANTSTIDTLERINRMAMELCRGGTVEGRVIKWDTSAGVDLLALKKIVGGGSGAITISGESWKGIKSDLSVKDYASCAKEMAQYYTSVLLSEDSSEKEVEDVFSSIRGEVGSELGKLFNRGFVLIYREGNTAKIEKTANIPSEVTIGELDVLYDSKNDHYSVVIGSLKYLGVEVRNSTSSAPLDDLGRVQTIQQIEDLHFSTVPLARTEGGGIIAALGISG